LPSSRRITSLALLIYGPLALAGVLWARIGTDRWPWSLPEPWLGAPAWARLTLSLGSGLALALVVVAVTPRLVERTRWARALEAQLREILAPLSKTQITLLAIVSGLAEEIFFRGAMQPVLGLVAASVIFGAAHLGPREVFPAWAIWAFLLGLVLGSIFALTGMLWGPILAHVWINQRNMIFLKRD
jgi:membrane protease YdiL (CAAX protease family)